MKPITSFQKTNLIISLALFGVTSIFVFRKKKSSTKKEEKPNSFVFPKLKYMEDPPTQRKDF